MYILAITFIHIHGLANLCSFFCNL